MKYFVSVMDYFKEYKRTANLSFLENVLMDSENGYKKTKITRNFIIKCLKINGRAIDILYKYDPSMLLDKELLKIAYTSTGPALMRSLVTCYRKTIRNILHKQMKYTIKKHGSMNP
jgi:hypothetical protein